MSKYKIGDLVRFKDDKLEVYSDKFVTLNFDLSDALGKVTGTIDMGPDGIFYHVDVKLNGMTLNLRMKEDQLLTPLEYLNKKVSECFSNRILPTFNPDRNSWMKDLIEKWEKEHPLNFDPAIVFPHRYIFGVDLAKVPLCENPSPVVVGKVKKFAEEAAAKKMSKSRCIKLLESYVAGRAKVKSGRKFERCLRDSVVDDALARAIELLKEKQ